MNCSNGGPTQSPKTPRGAPRDPRPQGQQQQERGPPKAPPAKRKQQPQGTESRTQEPPENKQTTAAQNRANAIQHSKGLTPKNGTNKTTVHVFLKLASNNMTYA